jgi:enoyl-CoA hydratase
MGDNVITIERDGHVATVWLDSPERRNALGPAFFVELKEAFVDFAGDDDVWCVVVGARGPAFTVGLDLKASNIVTGGAEEAPSETVRRKRMYLEIKSMQSAVTAVADCPKPVIAAVHGWCIGGGIDLICACDIRLASADARFSVRETRVAIVADLGTLQRLPGILTRGHAAELAFTGKDIDAARAREIGLVNDVYDDPDALHAAAQALAGEITANSPLAVQGVKQVLKGGSGDPVLDSLDYVAVWNAAFMGSDDLDEAMSAFRERRPPKFTGS